MSKQVSITEIQQTLVIHVRLHQETLQTYQIQEHIHYREEVLLLL